MNWTRHETRVLIESATDRPAMSVWAVKAVRRHGHEPGIVERIARLERFVLDASPHVWGLSDCSMVLADWAASNGHPDPGTGWRGTYDSEASCRALLERRGGLLNHIGICASVVGLTQVLEPEFGCIAVIGSTRNPDRQWGAIWNGFRWLVKRGDESRGVWTGFSAPALGMWRV